jgi:glycosyltransferase involved in cell wall biosynthesis
MPSILIFCKTLLKGGAEKQALILSKLLSEKGVNVIVLSWCGAKIDSSNLAYIKDNSLRYIGLSGNSITKFSAILKIIREEHIDIILSYLTKANLIAGLIKFINKDVIAIGGIRTEKLPFYKFQTEKIVHNYLTDGTVFNNYSGRGKFLKRGFFPEKLHVIHNTIHIPGNNNIHITSESINIISVCRFVTSKDFRTALISFKMLVEKYPGKNVKYYIVGYGPLERGVRVFVKKLNLQDRVEILINPPNIAEIFKKGHIYLSTSLFEGLSNSIMEAMVAGMPVVATDVGDNRYLIKEGYNGFLVPCGKVDLIVEKIGYLINNAEVRMELGKNSHAIIENEFSEVKFVENYFKLFSKIAVPLVLNTSTK